MNRRRLMFMLAGCLSLACAALASAQEVRLEEPRQKIATASFVRARTGPQFASAEVSRLRLGTVVRAVARTNEQDEIGGRKDYWYRIELPGGVSAWVFGGLLADYDPARRAETIGRIIEERLKVEGMSFEDGLDFYNFVAGALAEAKDTTAKGELERARLHALGRAVGGITEDVKGRAPYRDFLKTHEREIYYHELAGGWFVQPEAFWELERRYTGTAVGERIAWDAAQATRPGECESDEVCQFLSLAETEGRYLALYPKGAHASEVLGNLQAALSSEEIAQTLNSKGGDQYAAEARASLKKALAELRAAVQKTSAPEKDAVARLLDRLSPAGR